MSRAPEPDTTGSQIAEQKRAGVESGADVVEPRSDDTRNPGFRAAGRRSEAARLGADRAVLSPRGTVAARKITNAPAAAADSEPGETGAGDGAGESESSRREAERVERLRAWARAQVEQSPPWSERQWREVNAVLGYRLAKPE